MEEENFIGKLQKFCLEHKLFPPTYKELNKADSVRNEYFTYECNVSSFTETGKSLIYLEIIYCM